MLSSSCCRHSRLVAAGQATRVKSLVKPASASVIARHNHNLFTGSSSLFDINPDIQGGTRIGEVVLTTKHGHDLLLDPLLNKGTSFPLNERERLGIRGLVPPREPESNKHSLERSVKRIMTRYFELTSPIAKYSYMIALQDRNEVLFYRCLIDYLDELAPIIYTPTVGQACLSFSSLFRRPRGMYFSANDKGCMKSMIWNWPTSDVEIIVVTDGSRILGLGDLGTNGMGIPIGKLSLYTAGAGIHPSKTMPVLIDVGTNNEKLLNDPMYIGLQMKRINGPAYFEIVDEFIQAARERFPNALVQFEDFSNDKAMFLLEKYRNQLLCFNDDIQGTGCVVVSTILGALRSLGFKEPGKALKEQRIVVVGAGSAGLGVAAMLKMAMIKEGFTENEASDRFWIVDKDGLVGQGRDNLNKDQRKWIRSGVKDETPLLQVIEQVKPTIMIGLSGVHGVFTEQVITTMSSFTQHPIILALSNPTSQSECTAEEAYKYSKGQAIFASGSPFDPVEMNGKKLVPCQANNMYIFPGLGLGALACQARTITDNMLYAASYGLATAVTEADWEEGRILPPLAKIQEISAQVALAVMKQAAADGVAKLTFSSEEAAMEHIQDRQWKPEFGQLIRVSPVK